MGQVADVILASAGLCRHYADGLLKDVKLEQFARLATQDGKAVQSNHPAFVYGHLSTYPKKIAAMLGAPAIENPPGFEDLFKAGVTCLDDPSGTIYPSKDAIMKHYYSAYDAVHALIAKTSDADFAKANPAEGRMKELFPTIGAVSAFLLSGHQMSHFGQISAWRRFVGLGSAF